RRVSSSRIDRVNGDLSYGPDRQTGFADGPVGAAGIGSVVGPLDNAIIAAGVDDIRILGRDRDRLESCRVAPGEVGRDGVPPPSSIGAAPHPIGTVVQGVGTAG